ncbi:hypothetical protein Tco_1206791 [Tanacetum coccineum]
MYKLESTLFSIKFHYGGVFTKSPNRKYINGNITFVDMIDSDEFSVHEIDSMLEDLGQDGHRVMFYHFLKPGCDLDNGLEPIACDRDVAVLGNYVTHGLKLVEVFVEHEKTNPDIYTPPKAKRLVIEELDAEPIISKAGITPAARKLVLDVNNNQTCGKEKGKSSGKDLEGQKANHEVPTRVFKRIYVCLGPLKAGFKAGMRDLLGLDGAFMKGPYTGQVLTVVGVDPNNGDDLVLYRNSNFTFVSDRQKGIIPAIANLFPNAEHRYCVKHIHENMKKRWNGNAYKELLWTAASTTTVPEFQKAMEKLKEFSKEAYEWLNLIPPQHWSRSHFSGYNSRSCTGPRVAKTNKRKVPTTGMDDTHAPTGSQANKRPKTQGVGSASGKTTNKGKAPAASGGVPKKTGPKKKVINLG